MESVHQTTLMEERATQHAPSHLAQVVQATEEQRSVFRQQAEAQKIENDLHLAELFSLAGFFNGTRKHVKNQQEREQAKYEAFAKIRIGEEFGLKPAESMQAVYVDDFGRAGIEIHSRVAKALATGLHRYKISTMTRTSCEIQWFRKMEGQWLPCKPVSCTFDQLKHVKIQGQEDGKTLATKWNYESYPEDMMYAWCQRRNIRRYAPETQGSFPIAPHEEEALEDAGVRVATPAEDATDAKAQQNIADLFGDAPTPEAERPRDLDALAAHEGTQQANAAPEAESPTPDEKASTGDSDAPEPHDPFSKQRQIIHEAVTTTVGHQAPLLRSRFMEEGQTHHLAAYDKLMGTYRTCRDEETMDKMVVWVSARLAGEE